MSDERNPHKEEGGKQQDTDGPQPPKKPRTGCWGDPDVVVVVGGQEFQEHSLHLCSWSGYFNAALTREWKESKSKRFEFPHRKPEEWETLTSILAQFAKTKISKDNFGLVLSWCSELIIPNAMEECDRFLAEEYYGGVDQWLDVLKTTIEHAGNLPRARTKCMDKIAGAASSWNDKQLKEILELSKDQEDFLNLLCSTLLPSCLEAENTTGSESEQERESSTKLSKFCAVLPIVMENGAKESKDKCLELLRVAFQRYPKTLTDNSSCLHLISKAMAGHEDLCEKLWTIFQIGSSHVVRSIPAEERKGSVWLGLVHASLISKTNMICWMVRVRDLEDKLRQSKRDLEHNERQLRWRKDITRTCCPSTRTSIDCEGDTIDMLRSKGSAGDSNGWIPFG